MSDGACDRFVYKPSLHPELCGRCSRAEYLHPQTLHVDFELNILRWTIGLSFERKQVNIRLLALTIKIYKGVRT